MASEAWQGPGRPNVWPVHCVAGRWGAELHPALARERIDLIVDKGLDRDHDGYSAFAGTELDDILRRHRIRDVYVAGLATDYCVRSTALDACLAGYAVTVVEDAVRAIEREPGDAWRALQEVRARAAGWRVPGTS